MTRSGAERAGVEALIMLAVVMVAGRLLTPVAARLVSS